MLAHWLLIVPLQVTAIRDVTIIDGPASTPRPRHTVLMRNGRITSVGPQRDVVIPPGAHVIDGRGQYLLPGFVDVHAHVAFGPMSMVTKDGVPQMSFTYDHAASRETLQVLLAFGVTTARNPAGPAERPRLA